MPKELGSAANPKEGRCGTGGTKGKGSVPWAARFLALVLVPWTWGASVLGGRR
jgi:hypothetical protein